MALETIIPKRPAFQAWKAPLIGSDDRRQLIEAAILAANAHNSQPWRFEFEDNSILLSADPDRHLGSLDPFRREQHLSLGCAIENLVISAEAHGLKASVEARPGPLPPAANDDLAAIIRFAPCMAKETRLFRAIPVRHTNRGAYQIRAASIDVMSAMKAHARNMDGLQLRFVSGIDKAALLRIVAKATRDVIADKEMAQDYARWLRFRKEDIGARCDGLTPDANATSPWTARLSKLFPPSPSSALRTWLRDTRRVHVKHAALLGIISVRDLYDRDNALAAGRLWQRLHLELTAGGMTAQPLNQPLERVDRERQLNAPEKTRSALTRVLGKNQWRPTLIFRAGYPIHPTFASPRREVDAVIAA